MTVDGQRSVFGGRLDEELRNVEDQVAATGRARATIQLVLVLVLVPHGREGRARMLDFVYGLRDDPRAIAGVLASPLRRCARWPCSGRRTRGSGSDSGHRVRTPRHATPPEVMPDEERPTASH
ncbi:hypothetical protein ACIHCV_41725 [Streptomyces sp. NPDC051956]|uniref:hypothetical protein n=1 Tax=Streptomyces sp. NPDC051956 TaxID=3365677 RepID=UPI0037D1C4CC